MAATFSFANLLLGCNLHVRSKPTAMVCLQSVSGLVAEYDLISGCKLGSTEAAGTPISLAYTSDAALLVAVLQVPLPARLRFSRSCMIVHVLHHCSY